MKTILRRLRCLVNFAFFIAFVAQVHAGPAYTVTQVGDSGLDGLLFRINSSGQIAGTSYLNDGRFSPYRALLYSGGTTTFIDSSAAYDINASGEITGEFPFLSNNVNTFLYFNGNPVNVYRNGSNPVKVYSNGSQVGPLLGYGITGYGINDSAQVTGLLTYPPAGGQKQRAFLYSDWKMIDLGTLGGTNSRGFGINNSGQIAGTSDISEDTASHAFLYSGGKMTDLGTFGGKNSEGLGISDCGQVIGRASTGDQTVGGGHDLHAFLYSGGKMIDLSALVPGTHGSADWINSRGQVVGYYSVDNGLSGPWGAFLYSNGKMTNLNDLIPADSGWFLYRATGINDAGQIVGTGDYNGQPRVFRLDPVEPAISSVGPDCAIPGGVALSATTLSLSKGGASGTYTVQLTTAPTADVTLTLAAGSQLSAAPT